MQCFLNLTQHFSVVRVHFNDVTQIQFGKLCLKTFLWALAVMGLSSLPSFTEMKSQGYSFSFPLGHCQSDYPLLISKSSIYTHHLFLHLCFCLLSPRAHDIPEFLLKHQIWYFPPHPSSVVNLRDFSF